MGDILAVEARGLQVTKGVAVTVDSFQFEELGICVLRDQPTTRQFLLEYGFASRNLWRSAFGGTRSVRLDGGPLVSVLQSICHNCFGMSGGILSLSLVLAWALMSDATGIIAVACSALIFLGSVVAHEAGHVCMLKLFDRYAVAIAVCSGVRCRLIRKKRSGGTELAIVLAGPLTPVVIAPLFFVALQGSAFVVWVWLAVAVAHLVSILFPVGDGLEMRNVLREWRE